MVAVLASEHDRSVVSNLCWRYQWEVFFANTCEQARLVSDELNPQIVLMDRDVAGSGWRKAMFSLTSSSSEACIVLVSRVVDDYLWNEVVYHGGYEVVGKPIREDEVAKAVRLAWCYWRSAAKYLAAAKK
jgi:DNA-binding NarL/FixJ family response regulator